MIFDENSVMTAEEARARTWSSISEASNTQLQAVIKKINEAIDDGEYRCSVGGTISKRVEEILTKKGYKVSRGSQYNESYVDISWEDEYEYLPKLWCSDYWG